jgi:hypothetical protein
MKTECMNGIFLPRPYKRAPKEYKTPPVINRIRPVIPGFLSKY